MPGLSWRARYRDDDDRVWRASADTAAGLSAAWRPGKAATADVAALLSLRPVTIDVRVEEPGGAAASRTLTRRLLGQGVRRRRWRDGMAASLHLPAGDAVAAVVLDAPGGDGTAALLAAPLLASRGVLALALTAGRVEEARERLAAVAPAEPLVVSDVPLPPNVGTTTGDPTERAAAWDALLERIGAAPRSTPA